MEAIDVVLIAGKVVFKLYVVREEWGAEGCSVTISPCPSPKQAGSDKIVALKRCACDFMGQPRTDDDAVLSYLESVDAYKYDMLAIRRMIVQ
jgi:hypothetical protein